MTQVVVFQTMAMMIQMEVAEIQEEMILATLIQFLIILGTLLVLRFLTLMILKSLHLNGKNLL